jgi:serine/threonine-protein kinase
MVGQTISHYEITGKLGAGGMGVVYKARDLKLDRTVALKFLPVDVAVNVHDRENLVREARAASGLDHPNIGVIYGLEEDADNHIFIVMGYYDGETLAKKISSGLIPFSESIDLAIQTARGLSAAHARNIIHRDFKPSNIIITKDNVAKIVDFGLARVVVNSSATQTLQISGTLPYMAPEQVRGEPLSSRCDIWAFGVVLMQMVTGLHPFLRESTTATTFAVLNQPPSGIDDLPKSLRPIAYRALAKRPEYRYVSAKAILDELEAVHNQITSSRPATALKESTLTKAISYRQLKRHAEGASTPRWSIGDLQKQPSRLLYFALAVVALLSVSSMVPQVHERLAAVLSLTTQNHIAVLPFDNLGGDPANDVLAAGLMDALTGELSNINTGKQSLWVVPSSVVRSNNVSDPTAAGKQLGVNLVVKGSIQRSGQDVRLNVVLIDVRNLRQIGSAALEDRTGDLGTLQNEAVARLASLMKIKVSSEMVPTTSSRASPAAYELYLKALGSMQRYDKPGNLDEAISALKDAVNIDPQFALGFASLGEAYRLKNQVDPNQEWIEQSLANLQRAVQMDDHLPSPSVSLGRLHSSLGKNDLALQEFQKALAINPRNADAIMGMASVYERMGRVRDAEANFKKAAAMRPDYWDGYNSLGFFYFRQRRIPDAITQFRRVLELTPDNATAFSNLAGAYLELNDTKSQAEAESALRTSLELSPSYAAYANLGRLYLDQKRYADCALMTRKALDLNDQDYAVWDNLRLAYTWLGDESNARAARSKAQALLQRYAQLHPDDAGAHSLLSNFFAEDKNREKAQRQIDSALALQPNDGSVLADVAESYEVLGDRKRAIEFAHKSLENGYTLKDLQSHPNLRMLLVAPAFHGSEKDK